MAIKPDDCIIKIRDLEIGVDADTDDNIIKYEPYWENFLRYVRDTTGSDMGWDAYNKNFEKQLKKFNATYKNTKKWDDRYVKFNTHGDLTYFVLKWS